MTNYKVERTLLNDGVQISKWDGHELKAAIVLPWDKVGDVAGALFSLALGNAMLTASEDINKRLRGETNG